MDSSAGRQAFTPAGFPHSDICGSSDICSYPQLFAACRVLLRLSVPRHSPCALRNLTLNTSPRSAASAFRPGRPVPGVCAVMVLFLRRFPDTGEALSSLKLARPLLVCSYLQDFFLLSLPFRARPAFARLARVSLSSQSCLLLPYAVVKVLRFLTEARSVGSWWRQRDSNS